MQWLALQWLALQWLALQWLDINCLMSRHAMQWHAMQWLALHVIAMQWHAMQWHAMQWHAMQWHAMQHHAMQWHASLKSMVRVANISLFIYIGHRDYIQIVATVATWHLLSGLYISVQNFLFSIKHTSLTYFGSECLISHLAAIICINPHSHEHQPNECNLN